MGLKSFALVGLLFFGTKVI
uniref:Uncharacterized protein n=1 Tax=Arundo donax TaxID=35708 RepID=A0A0A9B099_ARUDO